MQLCDLKKAMFFAAALGLSQVAYALVDLDSVLYQSPRVGWDKSSRNVEFKRCMEEQIIAQASYSSNTKILWTGVVPRGHLEPQVLQTSYCVLGADGECKDVFHALIATTDVPGWKEDVSDQSHYASYAKDMTRYITFKNSASNKDLFTMDLEPCKAFFGVK